MRINLEQVTNIVKDKPLINNAKLALLVGCSEGGMSSFRKKHGIVLLDKRTRKHISLRQEIQNYIACFPETARFSRANIQKALGCKRSSLSTHLKAYPNKQILGDVDYFLYGLESHLDNASEPLTLKEIAKIYELKYETVRDRVSKSRLVFHKNLKIHNKDRIVELFRYLITKQYCTQTDIAQYFGVHSSTISAHLKTYKLDILFEDNAVKLNQL